MNNIVEFKNVYKKYGNTDALKGIDIKIPKGKIVGLLGPNGSGKTTMIKIMNGLLTTTEGEVLINGMKPGIETKKIVSYLPERTYLNDWMKVKDIIDFFKDFDKGTCKIISPISFGLSNSYGHPSSMVIKQLTSECHFPVYVTNDKRDLFTQVFEFEV